MNECGGNVEEGKLIFWRRVDKVHTHSRTCPTVQITFRFMLHVIPWKLCRARLAKLGNGSVHLSHHHSSCRLSKLGKSCNKTREALQEENCKKLLWQKEVSILVFTRAFSYNASIGCLAQIAHISWAFQRHFQLHFQLVARFFFPQMQFFGHSTT